METLTTILIGLTCFFILWLGLALLMKTEYTVSRSVIIQKPLESVFSYLKLLKNQDNFSVWAKMDPTMTKTYKGTDGQVGFVSAWDSAMKNVGSGEQEILEIEENVKIVSELRFLKPFKAEATAQMIVKNGGDSQTKVYWQFHGKMKYPFNLLLVFLRMDKKIGGDLAMGLHNLKEILERG
ncbi:SRPBCC family protein [Flectobacillus longus]|uniref:SRPBCC family protein n=1 Tax=Flectobacillus longus TaxID=2984207 RepID=UPI0024B84159|nr:SRPBCC family protein [Flectobacillus longus]MDI9881784.1 SRPBCC family protein [Flectobacillus longus]